MNPKSGTAGKAIKPLKPSEADEADKADPGEVLKEKQQDQASGKGKHGGGAAGPGGGGPGNASGPSNGKPFKKDPTKKSWIEIELIDQDDEPVPGARYEIIVPDGSTTSGSLDDKGFARVDGIDPGTCQITFPDLDKTAWNRA